MKTRRRKLWTNVWSCAKLGITPTEQPVSLVAGEGQWRDGSQPNRNGKANQ